MADPDAVPLTKDNADPILFEAEVNVQGVAKGFLGLLLRQIVIIMVDQTARFRDNEDVVYSHPYFYNIIKSLFSKDGQDPVTLIVFKKWSNLSIWKRKYVDNKYYKQRMKKSIDTEQHISWLVS